MKTTITIPEQLVPVSNPACCSYYLATDKNVPGSKPRLCVYVRSEAFFFDTNTWCSNSLSSSYTLEKVPAGTKLVVEF